jgi:hypothetical protein
MALVCVLCQCTNRTQARGVTRVDVAAPPCVLCTHDRCKLCLFKKKKKKLYLTRLCHIKYKLLYFI